MPPRGRRRASAKAETANRQEIVGRLIDIEWPSEGESTFFVALVLSFNPRHKKHKVIYLEEESIENLELGSAAPYRTWRQAQIPADPLIGARLCFQDKQVDESQESWFDFMRVNPDRRKVPFEVYVHAHIEHPDPEEVTGPRNSNINDSTFYRVIHGPNDYLTTVDLSSVTYDIKESLSDMETMSKQPGKEEAVDVDNDVVMTDDMPTSRSRVRAARTPTKPVDVIPDDENLPVEADAEPSKPPKRRLDLDDLDDEDDTPTKDNDEAYEAPEGTDRDKVVTIDVDEEDAASDEDKRSRRKSGAKSGGRPVRRRNARSRVAAEEDADADEGGTQGGRRAQQKSPDTLDTRDEPISSGGRKSRVAAEAAVDKSHDTASDEEMLGWAGKQDEKLSGGGGTNAMSAVAKVGDYISVESGGVGSRRKAYVEAFMPATGTHFVAFCDSQGGNAQMKLSGDNHSVLGDKEAEMLTRREAQVGAAEEAKVDEEAGEVIEVENVGEVKPRGRVGLRRGRKAPTQSKGRKKTAKTSQATRRRYSNAAKILGKPGGEEIVTRCVTVVWPNTKLVYVALVMGYNYESREHMLLYMVDHCIETLDLRYREWNLLSRGKEPWNSSGMVGKRVFVWWPGEYVEKETQDLAVELFGAQGCKVAYEAYVINFIGKGKYKIVYPSNEDCENRELSAEKSEGADPIQKEWDLLDEGINDVMGLPVIGWEG